MTKYDKAKLHSRQITEGPVRATHRSYYHAMYMTQTENCQPFIGIANFCHKLAPCSLALNRQTRAVKMCIKCAKGKLREFTTITFTNGITIDHEGISEMPATTAALSGQDINKKVVPITDGRFSDANQVFCVDQVSPEATYDRAIAFFKNGALDATQDEMSGAPRNYAQPLRETYKGAVTHSLGKAEKHAYIKL